MKLLRPTLLLRIAAIIMLLHAVAHGFAILNWQKPGGEVPHELVQKMQDTHFLVKGKDTTMAASFSGSGYSVTVFLFLTSTTLWFFSKRIGKDPVTILLLTGTAMLFLVAIESSFFFPLAAILTAISTVLVFIAVYNIKKI